MIKNTTIKFFESVAWFHLQKTLLCLNQV